MFHKYIVLADFSIEWLWNEVWRDLQVKHKLSFRLNSICRFMTVAVCIGHGKQVHTYTHKPNLMHISFYLCIHDQCKWKFKQLCVRFVDRYVFYANNWCYFIRVTFIDFMGLYSRNIISSKINLIHTTSIYLHSWQEELNFKIKRWYSQHSVNF